MKPVRVPAYNKNRGKGKKIQKEKPKTNKKKDLNAIKERKSTRDAKKKKGKTIKKELDAINGRVEEIRRCVDISWF